MNPWGHPLPIRAAPLPSTATLQEVGQWPSHLVPSSPSLTPHGPFPAAVTHTGLSCLRTCCSFCQERPFCPTLPCWLLLSTQVSSQKGLLPTQWEVLPSFSSTAPGLVNCSTISHWSPGCRRASPQEHEAPGSMSLSLLHCYVQPTEPGTQQVPRKCRLNLSGECMSPAFAATHGGRGDISSGGGVRPWLIQALPRGLVHSEWVLGPS